MAGEVSASRKAEIPVELIKLLLASAHLDLCKADGDFLKYRKKGKWEAAAKQAGLSKADGGRLTFAA
jgi:exodeoxyribonuclease-5